MIFEGLYCPFGGVDSVIVGLDQLEFNFFFIERLFYCMGDYSIHDVELWAETTILKVFDVIGESFDN